MKLTKTHTLVAILVILLGLNFVFFDMKIRQIDRKQSEELLVCKEIEENRKPGEPGINCGDSGNPVIIRIFASCAMAFLAFMDAAFIVLLSYKKYLKKITNPLEGKIRILYAFDIALSILVPSFCYVRFYV